MKIKKQCQPKSIFGRRQQYRDKIRKQQMQQKIQRLRHLNFSPQYLCIPQMIKSLPNSISDMINLITSYRQVQSTLSKLIIDFIYEKQLLKYVNKQQSQQYNQQSQYCLVRHINEENSKQIIQQVYLIAVLIENQGIHAGLIIKKYFFTLLAKCKIFKQLNLLWRLISIIIKNVDLQYVPLKQIQILLQQSMKQKNYLICNDQLILYRQLSRNYHEVIFNQVFIYNRIQYVMQQSSNALGFVDQQVFMKLAINLTFYESQKQDNITFHKALIKGGIKNIIFLNIFYKDKCKQKLISLDLLNNLIVQFGSQMLWKNQKFNPMQYFQQQIYDQTNDFKIKKTLINVFLISILKINTIDLLESIVNGEVKTLQLILYILQHFQNHKQIKKLIVSILQILLEELCQKSRFKVANILIQKQWQKYLYDEDKICKKIQQQITQRQIQI